MTSQTNQLEGIPTYDNLIHPSMFLTFAQSQHTKLNLYTIILSMYT